MKKLSTLFYPGIAPTAIITSISPIITASAMRGRPIITPRYSDNSNLLILTDEGTLLRGVSLSYDGGDPFNASQDTPVPTLESFQALKTEYGLNAVHAYLNGDASDNVWEIGYNEEKADLLVSRTAAAGLYLIITIGCNGENGSIYSMTRTLAFWDLYGTKYKDQTHVIYEAHNEPVAFTPNHWTTQDWDKQVVMYNKIRGVAPDTLILLGSFMSFNGADAAINGADYLASQGVDWSNAAFAFHGYTGLGSIEDTIAPFEAPHPTNGGMYPALLCTEFWPGDTENGYNEAFESHYIGWLQFEWLGACDTDLDAFKARVDRAATVWIPDDSTAEWPAPGLQSAVPQSTGLFKFSESGYLRVDPNDGYTIKADASIWTNTAYDTFYITPVVGTSNRVHLSILESGQPRYLFVEGEGELITLSPQNPTLPNEDFEFVWIETRTNDILLRAYGGGGHYLSIAPNGKSRNKAVVSGDNALIESVAVVTTVGSGPVSPPLPPPNPVPPPGPFYGIAQTVPGTINFVDFDHGGEGVAYHDSDTANVGEVYRPDEGVDIQSSVEDCIPNVGWVAVNEWLTYTINVQSDGEYDVSARLAATGDCTLNFSVGDSVATVSGSNTGGWQAWQDFISSSKLFVLAGEHIVRVDNVQGGCNMLTFTLSSGSGTSSPTASPTAVPSLRPSTSVVPSSSSSSVPSANPSTSLRPIIGCLNCPGLPREVCQSQSCAGICKWQGSCKDA